MHRWRMSYCWMKGWVHRRSDLVALVRPLRCHQSQDLLLHRYHLSFPKNPIRWNRCRAVYRLNQALRVYHYRRGHYPCLVSQHRPSYLPSVGCLNHSGSMIRRMNLLTNWSWNSIDSLKSYLNCCLKSYSRSSNSASLVPESIL